MKRLALAVVLLAVALPALAQTPDEPPAEAPAKPKRSMKDRWFVGGAIGATFGTVDSIDVAPLVGFHVVPRFDVGTQLFYRWINDGRYSPSISTNDYGLTLFARFRVYRSLFLEADYQYTNYEYVTGTSTTARSTYNSFLAGAGYGIPLGGAASFYFSVMYDFGYNNAGSNYPYDSPWRVQLGAMVGF